MLLLFSCGDSKLAQNKKNLQKVQNGMSIFEIKQIMGEPDKIVSFKSEPNFFRYMYKAPSGSSDNYYIIFSVNDSSVNSINYGN